MQCSSDIPVCYPTKDRNATESDRTSLQNDDRTIQINDQAYTPFTTCSTNHYQGNEIEILRQTMVQQEATFKDQLNNLHCLYNRQRELMGEYNMRELSRDAAKGNTQTNNHVLSQNQSELTQTSHITSLILEDPGHHWPSSSFKLQPSIFYAGESRQAASNPSVTAGICNDPILLQSSDNKIRKRTFDLELPADQYINCEEERSGERDASILSQASDNPSKDISATYRQSTSKLSIYNYQSNHSEGNSSGNGIISNVADFNRTFHLDNHQGLYNCMSGSMPVAIQAPPYFGLPVATQVRPWFGLPANSWLDNKVCINRNSICDPRSPNVCSFQNNLLPRFEYSISRLGPHSSTSLDLNNAAVRYAEEVDSASVRSRGLSNLAVSQENIRATQGKEKLQDTFTGWNWLRDTLVPSRITNKRKESLNRVSEFQIDLNSPLNEDGSAPAEVEMTIAAPFMSPENNEFSQPKGTSKEKQLAEFVQFAEQEDGCPKQDRAMVAAETLVSMCGINFACLRWFAGIASSAGHENETLFSSGADSNNSELYCGEINEYAALVCQLKDMKLEENCCKNTGNKNRISATSSASQPNRKQIKRTK